MGRNRTLTVFAAGLLAIIALSFLAAPASAGDEGEKRFLYQWTDKRGNAHISDSLEKVPAEFRSRAKRLEQGPAEAPAAREQQEVPLAEPRGFGFPAEDVAAQNEEERKAEWQQRMYDAKQRMADAEDRLRQYGGQLKAIQEKFGYGLYGYPPEAAAEAARLEQEVGRAQTDLDHARDQVENVIPEQARKAGIPPGWLREVP